MSNSEISSALSSHKEFAVKERLGGACILCGCPSSVNVAHILARNTHGNAKLEELLRWSPQLAAFREDDYENLVCFCPTHLREYTTGQLTIVPSPQVRRKMIQHELDDFERRQRAVSGGEPDPGRTLLMPPQLPYEFEYVPVEVPLYYECHTATQFYPETFLFSSQDIDGYPLRRWEVSIYAVLMASCPTLASPARIISARSDAAQDDVNQLIRLYQRRLTAPSRSNTLSLQESTAIPTFISSSQQFRNTVTRVQESPSGPATVGNNTGEQGSLMGGMADEGYDLLKGGGSAKAETSDVPIREDEPVVTPAVLSSRIHWRPTESRYGDEGSMRFATSSDFVVSTTSSESH